jgi:hypothetical protein
MLTLKWERKQCAMPAATRKQVSAFQSLEAITQPPPQELNLNRGPGRPRGKRSDDTYRTWSGFLPKEALRKASIRLMETSDKRDMSDLLGELLTTWVEQQAQANS